MGDEVLERVERRGVKGGGRHWRGWGGVGLREWRGEVLEEMGEALELKK